MSTHRSIESMAMVISEQDSRSLLPSFLYSSSTSLNHLRGGSFISETLVNRKKNPLFNLNNTKSVAKNASASGNANAPKAFVVPTPSEPGKIAMYSPAFYVACTMGGILSCGLTHTGVTPLDLIKCNMQIDPAKYKSITIGFGVLMKEQGAKGLFKGWVPTLLGYSAQGACTFGFYEFFKKYYSDIAGPEYAAKYKMLIYLAGSASVEFIADIALCPFEVVKV